MCRLYCLATSGQSVLGVAGFPDEKATSTFGSDNCYYAHVVGVDGGIVLALILTCT